MGPLAHVRNTGCSPDGWKLILQLNPLPLGSTHGKAPVSCVWLWPFLFFSSWAPSKLTSSRCSGNSASNCSGTSSLNALNSRSWDRPFLVCRPWCSPHRSLWEEAAEKQPWQPEACERTPGFHLECFVGAKIIGHRGQWLVISVPQRWWPNICALNCALPCTSELQFCFCLAIPHSSSFCSLCNYLKKKHVQGAGKRQCMDTSTECHHCF